jgi:Tfp pilus assembly protein PilV
MQQRTTRRGFSLIEVNLAIFVVAMGMLTLFSLFPSGLRQAETAHESTQEALFADYVLSTLRAEAMLVTNATEWLDMNQFRSLVMADLPLGGDVKHGATPVSVQFPDADLRMRYILQLNDEGNNLRSASLWCRSGEFGSTVSTNFMAGAAKFYTEFFYSGMP